MMPKLPYLLCLDHAVMAEKTLLIRIREMARHPLLVKYRNVTFENEDH